MMHLSSFYFAVTSFSSSNLRSFSNDITEWSIVLVVNPFALISTSTGFLHSTCEKALQYLQEA